MSLSLSIHDVREIYLERTAPLGGSRDTWARTLTIKDGHGEVVEIDLFAHADADRLAVMDEREEVAV